MTALRNQHPTASRAALASVATALLLLTLKSWAALTTESIAMLGSLADTALDLVASLVTLWGVRVAASPPDRDHRFGHGKAEALAALFQVALIAVSATAIAARAVSALVAGGRVREAGDGIVVSIVSVGATLVLLAYQRRVIAATGSIAIRADQIHYQSDLALNAVVILALVLDRYAGMTRADPVLGVVVALWLGFGAWRASAAAIAQLMDQEWPDERRRRFIEVANRHPELKRIHDLRTRSSGTRDFVQFHTWVDADMTVAEAHRVMDEVEARLAREFPGVEILIHIDPEGQIDEPDNPLAEADAADEIAPSTARIGSA